MDVAITGRGLITPLGNGLGENELKLRKGQSGVVFVQEWKDMHLESCVAGLADNDPECPLIDKKIARFTTPNGKMALAAVYEALQEARIAPDEIKGKRVAVILGCGGSTFLHVCRGGDILRKTGKVKRVSPFIVPKAMNSSAAANISLVLGLTGESYSISSACTSGAHSIMLAARLIQSGAYDIVITGGSEEVNWLNALGFDAMKALSRKYNDSPEKACRPFDRDRDGFVIAEGAGILILERAEHAESRGAELKSLITGISANSNASDMVVPDSDSACTLMKTAIDDAGLSIDDIGYINTHGTATPVGDLKELEGIRKLLGRNVENVAVSSTKSMTGHMIGATGAVEAVFCSMMVEKQFIAPTINLDTPEKGYEDFDFVTEKSRNVPALRHIVTNSFGFGGTNASLVISRCSRT
jgi:3-oxoacyl-[acyl-carrier-protein] synthase-1